MSDHQPASAPTFCTIPETAERLKVSPKTVRRWIEHGTLNVHRFGKQIRIAETDLLAFIEGCRQ
ncbi:MAG: helix-turn-helix domain-containing protein [Alphaproteobacteria bacterium]|nr:helix-turn-helix domain-containing protein [Alphaproteobacteria bacterium]